MNRSLHPRNKHNAQYDLRALSAAVPELTSFLVTKQNGELSLDFSDNRAVKYLNRALLKTHYDVQFWDIPDTYLCPPVPGRVDYLHYLADLLAEDNQGELPRGRTIKALDIGTGANLIYPLTGSSEYGWHFCASDIDPVSVKVAKELARFNGRKITIKQQKNPAHIFEGIIGKQEFFHLTLCNPPFHASAEQAREGTQRKWKNLGKKPAQTLNFGGQNAELWCPGGEERFITDMINESSQFAQQALWFSSLVSKKETLPALKRELANLPVKDVKVIAMAQGNKQTRFIAWTFMDKQQREQALNSAS